MLSTRKKTPSAGNPVSGMRVHVVSWQSSWPQSHNSLASVTDVRSGRLTGELPTHNSHTANYDSTVFIRVSDVIRVIGRQSVSGQVTLVEVRCQSQRSQVAFVN
jgi:hypothetical protein